MKKEILFILIVCFLVFLSASTSGFSTHSTTISRSFDKDEAVVGDPITVTVSFTNLQVTGLRGFYYTEQIPQELWVDTVNIRINGSDISYLFESGSSGEIYPGSIPYWWVLETPIFAENNPIPENSLVEIVYTVTSSQAGTFGFDEFSWVGYYETAPAGERAAFGHSEDADKQTITFTEAPQLHVANLLPGSVLPGSTVTFQWTDNGAAGMTDWWLHVGSGLGEKDLYDSGFLGASLSDTVSGLPTDGSQIFVRLWYRFDGGVWQFIDVQYTAFDDGLPEITSPVPGTVLPGSTVTFQWTDNGAAGMTDWWLRVGSSLGEKDLYDSGFLGASLSDTVSGLPTIGSQIFVRLWYRFDGGVWQFIDVQYTGDNLPEITSPVPGTVLPGSTVTFQWTDNGAAGMTDWWLRVGSSLGERDLYDSGFLGASLSDTVSGLPTDGSQIFVRLWYRFDGGVWQFIDVQYTGDNLPEITSPVPGTVLPGSTVTFQWTDNGAAGMTDWWLRVGSSLGEKDLYDSGFLGANLSDTVRGLPTDGSQIFVRLWYRIDGGAWQFIDAQYTAFGPTET